MLILRRVAVSLLLVPLAACDRRPAPSIAAGGDSAIVIQAMPFRTLAAVESYRGDARIIVLAQVADSGGLGADAFRPPEGDLSRFGRAHPLTLLEAGRPAGRVVAGERQPTCGGDSSAEVLGGASAPEEWSALATDRPVPPGPPLRRPPTPAERAAMEALLRETIQAYDTVRWVDAPRKRIDAVAMPDGGTALVGSSWPEWTHGTPVAWGAFIVAERVDGRWQPVLTVTGDSDEAYYTALFDVVDLDGDGIPELVTSNLGQYPLYQVIQRRADQWEILWGGPGC
ncbi:MAG TPA: hypothetical protein VF092_12465 [Longimicrobium sp.]